jgi:hypothetical protein
MKLLGWELSNYASIKRQFIPMNYGLQLIVGKNNAGKTATLRFLDKEASDQIDEYGDLQNRPAISLIAQYELGDPTPIPGTQPQEITRTGGYVRFECPAGSRTISSGFLNWQDYRNQQVFGCNADSAIPMQLFTKDGSQKRHLPAMPMSKLLREAVVLKSTIYMSPHRQIAADYPMKHSVKIPGDGNALAPYLQTLNSEHRTYFDKVERAFCELFPEFDQIILPGRDSSVSISLKRRVDQARIPINRCGNGIEQALVLLSAVYHYDPREILLIDEPHNFLHPGAERKLALHLASAGRPIIAATHSPILINNVDPSQITLIEPPGEDYEKFLDRKVRYGQADVLRVIGFKNSDALFHDGLIFVEGTTDRELIRILLESIGMEKSIIANIGFPLFEGVSDEKPDRLVGRLLNYERFLESLGRIRQMHIYLLDRDREKAEEAINRANWNGKSLPVSFTGGMELENIFLDAGTIAQGLAAEAKMRDVPLEMDHQQIGNLLEGILSTPEDSPDYSLLFPRLKGLEIKRIDSIKGSLVLSKIWTRNKLNYEKMVSGRMLASYAAPQRIHESLAAVIEFASSLAGTGLPGAPS